MSSKARSLGMLALALVLGVASFAVAPHAALAQAGTPQDPTITSVSCTITVSFTAPDTETNYGVEIWDDGVQVFSQAAMAGSVGQLLSFSYTFTQIGDQAPGVAVIVTGNGTEVFMVDPYTDIDESCTPGGGEVPATTPPCAVGFPSGSVVGTFVAPAQLYSVPGQLVTPGLSLDAGKSAWVIGLDASGQYYKIFFACKLLWVQANTLGPNFDKVWNGTPLPNRSVGS